MNALRISRAWLTDGIILASWLATVGVVAMTEHGLWVGGLRGLRIISPTLDVNEQWFGLYYQGQKVGFTNVMLMPDERGGIPGFSIVDEGRLAFSLLGIPQVLQIHVRAFVDADYRLHHFVATVQAEGYHLKLSGRREGDTFLLVLSSPASSVSQRLRDPAGRIWVSGLSSWATFHQPQVGQRGRTWILNPLALKPEPVHFFVRRRETVNGQDAFVIETDYRGVTATTWITPEGIVLKETSPMGWDLVQEPMEQALTVPGKDTRPIDLLSTVAVSVDRRLEDPASLSSLTLLVEGVDAQAFRVDRRPWQELLPSEQLEIYGLKATATPWCLLRLTRPTSLPAPLSAQGISGQAGSHARQAGAVQDAVFPAPPTRYHLPSVFIQSDDAMIKQEAREIVGELTEPWSQAVSIHHWVFSTLAKRLTIGLPSAKDVLFTKAGDCHEHTVLFTALARSLGIPTRMVAGLVYYQDRFYYHAWPEVWRPSTYAQHIRPGSVLSPEPSRRAQDATLSRVEGWRGVWIPLDPTLGQAVADLTHVGLVEAEGDELVALAQFVGQLRLRVLDMKERNQ